jgi:hypothetical protein
VSTYDRKQLFSIPELKTRQWTDTAIKRFLPEPDDTRPNPHYSRAGEPMKFWLKTRVQRVEKTKRFLEWKSGAVARRVAANKGVMTKVINMEERINEVKITIIGGKSRDEIEALAVRTHGGNYQGDPGPFYFNNQVARNCIRHNLTNYEKLWKLINRGETGEGAYHILRERVDQLIDEVYPEFSDAADDDL